MSRKGMQAKWQDADEALAAQTFKTPLHICHAARAIKLGRSFGAPAYLGASGVTSRVTTFWWEPKTGRIAGHGTAWKMVLRNRGIWFVDHRVLWKLRDTEPKTCAEFDAAVAAYDAAVKDERTAQ